MRQSLVIAAHHLRRTARNPGLILLLLAIPVTIALIEWAAFGRMASTGKLPPIPVLILDEDDTFISRAVPQLFAGGPMKDSFQVSAVERLDGVPEIFRRGEASAVVRVPAGFQDSLLHGSEAVVEIYRNPVQTFSPDVAESVLEMGAVVANGLYGQAREPLARIRDLLDDSREPDSADVAEIAVGFFEAGQRLGRLDGLEELSVEVHRAGGEKSEGPLRGPKPSEFFATIFPGLVLFSLLFIGQALGVRLLRDRLRGLERRLAVTPASHGAVLAGGVLYLVAGLAILLLVLGAVGSLIFQIPLRDPLALAVFGLGFAVFASALQLLISAYSRDDGTAQAVSSVVVILLTLMGGTFVPAEILPGFLKTLAGLVPNGAGQQGLVEILVRSRPLEALAGKAGVVWGWAALTLAAALWAERRRLLR